MGGFHREVSMLPGQFNFLQKVVDTDWFVIHTSWHGGVTMFDKLDDYARRPLRYQNVDGLWEMGIGFLWLGMAFLDRLKASAPRNSVHWRLTAMVSAAALVLLVFYSVRLLKKRITYPRTGFVKYRGRAGKAWAAGAIAAAVAILVVILSVSLLRHLTYSVWVAVEATMWALLYAMATRLAEPWRWVVLAVMIGGPVAISTLPVDREWLGALHNGYIGLTLFVSGTIALYLYLHRTRPPEQEAE